jgi:hypothetical protein
MTKKPEMLKLKNIKQGYLFALSKAYIYIWLSSKPILPDHIIINSL